jgi:hypothetical protein
VQSKLPASGFFLDILVRVGAPTPLGFPCGFAASSACTLGCPAALACARPKAFKIDHSPVLDFGMRETKGTLVVQKWELGLLRLDPKWLRTYNALIKNNIARPDQLLDMATC